MKELVIDSFAGGGGASLGMEMAGLFVDIAINHDEAAIEMHRINHPRTRHFCEDIWKVKPLDATGGAPVGLMWFSPDCTHFSRAKGGKPVKKKIRGLAWVVVRWAKVVRPRVIILENVAEFQEWGPLRKDNRPNKRLRGKTFNFWLSKLKALGYKIEWRELVAADYGAPTIRKRLFLIARCDGEPIVWPNPTHGKGLRPYRAAAECIDWSIPCPSIFERKRPLAENTLRRIARGIQKYVIETKEPFVIGIDHQGSNGGCVWPVDIPLRTITKENRFALVAPCLTKYHGQKANESRCRPVDKPITTVDTSNRFALVAAFLSKYYSCSKPCSGLNEPTPTVTAIDHNALVAANLVVNTTGNPPTGANEPLKTITTGGHHALVATHLTKFYGTNTGSGMREPVPTITGQGQHLGEVRAFLIKYYGQGTGQSVKKPLHTVTSKDTFGLVTVEGQQYRIADIGLRMLTPRELARAQGLPDSYILTGTKANQVAKIGNSVPPAVVKSLVNANMKLQKVSKNYVA